MSFARAYVVSFIMLAVAVAVILFVGIADAQVSPYQLTSALRELGLAPFPNDRVVRVTWPPPTTGSPVVEYELTVKLSVPAPGIPAEWAWIAPPVLTLVLPENTLWSTYQVRAMDAQGRYGESSPRSPVYTRDPEIREE